MPALLRSARWGGRSNINRVWIFPLPAPQFIKTLAELIEPYKEGILPLHFYYQSPEGRALLRGGVEWRVSPKEEMLTKLKNLLGENAVELEFE